MPMEHPILHGVLRRYSAESAALVHIIIPTLLTRTVRSVVREQSV